MSSTRVDPAQLRQFPFFSELNEEEVAAIASACKLCSVASKEWLFRAGDPGTSAYLVISGRLAVLLRSQSNFEVLDIFAKGAIFGELCLIEQSARSADVRAIENSLLIEISADNFALIQNRAPLAAVKVIKEVALRTCERIRAVNQRIENYLASEGRSQIGSTLPPIALTSFDDLVAASPEHKLSFLGRLLAKLWA